MILDTPAAQDVEEPGSHSPCSADEGVLFRRYLPDSGDAQQMGDLAFQNAFLGKPFDAICNCRGWFTDVVLGPYIRHQPENIHVAVLKSSGRLVGYLTGSTGGPEFETLQYQMVRNKIMSLAASVLMPWNFIDHPSRLFTTHVILNGEKERPTHPQQGVHWHFQVADGFRNLGVGTELYQRFKSDALKAHFRLIWAEVMAYKDKPKKYFEARGWNIYDAKRTDIFGSHVDFPVQVLCITKPLLRASEERVI